MSNYNEQFNRQLTQQLRYYRQKQPNHIPVYAMKYKNASKYLVQDLQQPLGLFPKKFKLKTIYEIIEKQSLEYCKNKLKNDQKVKLDGEKFKIPSFNMYTIEIQKINENEEEISQNQQNRNKKSRQKPLGKFVKLDAQMTYAQAFQKFGRENVLTIIYTDATTTKLKHSEPQKTVQKWLTRLLILIILLIVVPFLMKDSSPQSKLSSTHNYQQNQNQFNKNEQSKQQKLQSTPFDQISINDIVELDDTSFSREDLQGGMAQRSNINQQYEDETI